MAITKSAKQEIKVNERNRCRNQAIRSRMKTYVKQAEDAIEAGDAEKIKPALSTALSEIDKAATKGVLHKNNAGRKKSNLQRHAAKATK